MRRDRYRKRIVVSLLSVVLSLGMAAQNQDCAGTVVICDNSSIAQNPSGAGSNDFGSGGNEDGCLAGEHQSAWFYFEFDVAMPPNSVIEFTIDPQGSTAQDYDFAMWGPNVQCGTLGLPVRCSFAAPGGNPPTGLGNGAPEPSEGATGDGWVAPLIVQPGEGYFLLIDNYSNNGIGFDFTWGGTAAGFLNCNADPNCIIDITLASSQTACSGGSVQLQPVVASNMGTPAYTWTSANGGEAFLNDPFSPNPTVTIPQGYNGTIFYTLTVNNGICTESASVSILVSLAEPPQVQSDYVCSGHEAMLAVVNGPYNSYEWSNGMSGVAIEVAQAGNYAVTVTNANGCEANAEVAVVSQPDPAPEITGSTVICPGDTVGLIATPGFVSYDWSAAGSEHDSLYTATTPDTYSVTVTDAMGCQGEVSFVLDPGTEPSPQITGGPTLCPGETLVLDAGPGFATYQWSNGTMEQQTVIDQEGTYSVSVTDTSGCEGSGSITIGWASSPNVNISGDLTLCPSSATVLTADPGFASYSWNTNEDGAFITVTDPGDYTVTVTDDNGCSGVATTTVTLHAVLDPGITGDLSFCEGDSTLLTAPPGFSVYSWSNGLSGQAVEISQPGVYTVTVTDVEGCTGEDSVMVIQYSLPEPSFTGETTFCPESQAVVEVSGTYIEYVWSNNVQGPVLITDVAGPYSVTVTDTSGCTGTATVAVIEWPAPDPVITGEAGICPGGETTLDAGPAYATYSWSNGSITQQAVILEPGSVGVTVTDDNGCEGVDEIIISELTPPSPSITGEDSFCENAFTVLSADAGYSSYLWSTSEQESSIAVSAAGTYSLTVTDTSGCAGSASFSVAEDPLPIPLISGETAFCPGDSTTLTAGGGYSAYYWSTGSEVQQIIAVAPGVVSVTVTDEEGCQGTASVALSQFPAPLPNITGTDGFCEGEGGVLDAGGGYVEYLWSDGSASQLLEVPESGEYSVTVTDENGCQGKDEIVISADPAPQPVITGPESICTGGTATLDAGAGFATYQWSGNSSGPTLGINSGGVYSVTVTDENGCTNSAEVTVVEIASPVPIIEGPTFFCEGSSTDLSVAGSFIAYEWSALEGMETITIDQEGTYTVTVTASEGCTGVDSVTVIEIPLPVADAGDDKVLTCETDSVRLGGEAFGEGESFVYQWEGPGINASNFFLPNPEVDQPGIYSLKVLETEHGCESNLSVIEVLDLSFEPLVVLTVEEALDCRMSSVPINGAGSAVGPGIVYRWYDESGALVPDAETLVYEAAQPQQYTLEVLDTLTGCMAQATVMVEQDTTAPVALAGEPRHLTCAVTTVTLDGSGSTNDPDSRYRWLGPDGTVLTEGQSPVAETGTPGLYILQVQNIGNGCISEDSVRVSQDIALPAAEAGEDHELDCHRREVTLSAAGSSTGDGFLYAWTTSDDAAFLSDQPTVKVTEAGLYRLEVLNTENGCVATDEVEVTSTGNFPTAIRLQTEDPTCFGDTDGNIVITGMEGGASPFLYSLNGQPLGINALFSQLPAGAYELVVQDAAGCELDTTVLLHPGNDLELDLGADVTIILGETAALSAQVNIGRGQIAAFGWEARDSFACRSCLDITVQPEQTTTYQATVTDLNGCSVTESVTVFVENPQEVYLPNAFSPNGDGNNDIFMIYAGRDVQRIKTFLIFNRWGELIFRREDFPANDPDYGWDGAFLSADVNANVFVWFAEVEFIDGQTGIFKGDVLLIR